MGKIGVLFPAKGETDIDGRAVEHQAKIEDLHGATAAFKVKDGREYTISLDKNAQPIIKSKQTGRIITFSWSDIISLALNRGIDDAKPIPNPLQPLGKDYVRNDRRQDSGNDSDSRPEGDG